jgi:hypothetical protein
LIKFNYSSCVISLLTWWSLPNHNSYVISGEFASIVQSSLR